MNGRRRGTFSPSETAINVVLIAIAVTAYILLGRWGWPWYQRIIAIFVGCYALFFVLIYVRMGVNRVLKNLRKPRV